jgi:hypothetical protein
MLRLPLTAVGGLVTTSKYCLRSHLSTFAYLSALLLCGCDDGDDSGSDGVMADADGETGDGDSNGDGDGDGETEEGGEELDSDGDGLTDVEEIELGTDPNLVDTDQDSYWDSWEVNEGTNPLDPGDRIYQAYWPYNPDKDELVQGTWAEASTLEGSQFPRQEFLDQLGDYVDIYDLSNFTGGDGEPNYFIIDMSAQWCGPCHNMAEWISGVDSPDTAPLQQNYPSVREKIENYRIWWVTIIVENSSGGAPTLSDSQSWYGIHQDSRIPVLVDETQQVRNTYNGGSYPFFFLLDPVMAVEFWDVADAPGDNTFPALWMVQQHL